MLQKPKFQKYIVNGKETAKPVVSQERYDLYKNSKNNKDNKNTNDTNDNKNNMNTDYESEIIKRNNPPHDLKEYQTNIYAKSLHQWKKMMNIDHSPYHITKDISSYMHVPKIFYCPDGKTLINTPVYSPSFEDYYERSQLIKLVESHLKTDNETEKLQLKEEQEKNYPVDIDMKGLIDKWKSLTGQIDTYL